MREMIDGVSGAVGQGEGLSLDESLIRQVLESFARGGDEQDVDRVASVLHTLALQCYMGVDGVTTISTSAYLEMIEEKKIGGVPRQLEIHSIDVTDSIASAKVSISKEGVRFDNYMALLKVGPDWKLVSNVFNMQSVEVA